MINIILVQIQIFEIVKKKKKNCFETIPPSYNIVLFESTKRLEYSLRVFQLLIYRDAYKKLYKNLLVIKIP